MRISKPHVYKILVWGSVKEIRCGTQDRVNIVSFARCGSACSALCFGSSAFSIGPFAVGSFFFFSIGRELPA